MSRSQPTPQNPAQHFFTWSGSQGQLTWYNKEKQVKVPVKIPFEFLVLDELATITGFCEADGSGYWSNEIRSVTKDELTVRTAKGTKQVGLYANLADVRAKGAKYAKSIYIAHKIGDEYVIGNIKASGAALTAWIELGSSHVLQNGKIRLTGSVEGKKGTNTYLIPVFEYDHASDEENNIAIELDKQLQVYLSQYLAAAQFNRTNQEEETPEDDHSELDDTEAAIARGANAEDEAATKKDFARNWDKLGKKSAKPDVVIEDISDEPINLDEIPF